LTGRQQWRLLFDGECPYCCRFAEMVRKFDHDNLVAIISLQEHSLDDDTIPLDELLEDVHLLDREGNILKGGDAVNRIITLVPGVRPFRWMVESRWGHKGTELLYRTMKSFRGCRKCDK